MKKIISTILLGAGACSCTDLETPVDDRVANSGSIRNKLSRGSRMHMSN